TRIVTTYHTISALLGHCGGRRFTAVFSPDSPDCPAATGWHRTHYCSSHWFCHYGGQHPAHRFFAHPVAATLYSGATGYRPDAGFVGSAPPGIVCPAARPAIP